MLKINDKKEPQRRTQQGDREKETKEESKNGDTFKVFFLKEKNECLNVYSSRCRTGMAESREKRNDDDKKCTDE